MQCGWGLYTALIPQPQWLHRGPLNLLPALRQHDCVRLKMTSYFIDGFLSGKVTSDCHLGDTPILVTQDIGVTQHVVWRMAKGHIDMQCFDDRGACQS